VNFETFPEVDLSFKDASKKETIEEQPFNLDLCFTNWCLILELPLFSLVTSQVVPLVPAALLCEETSSIVVYHYITPFKTLIILL
jgi:hypothetical protein